MTIKKLLENIDPKKDLKLFEETIANYIEIETESKYDEIIGLVVDKVFDEVKTELDVEQEEKAKELEQYIDLMIDTEIDTLKDINLAQDKLDKAEALIDGIHNLYFDIMGETIINEVNKKIADELAQQQLDQEEKAKAEAEKEMIKEKKLVNRLLSAENEAKALSEKVASLELELKTHEMLAEANLSQMQSERIKMLMEGTEADKYLTKLQMYIDSVQSISKTSTLNEVQQQFKEPVSDKKLTEEEYRQISDVPLSEVF